MAETTEKTGEKKLSVGSNKTLSLKARGVEQSVVRQNFSHGRTKQVLVEKVKTRAPAGKAKVEPSPPAPVAPAPTQSRRSGAPSGRNQAAAAAPAKPSGLVLKTLTAEEQQARVHALADARLKDAEERRIAEEQAHIRELRDAIERTEHEAAEARKREEDDRRRHEEEAKRKAEQEAKKRFGGEEEVKPKLPVGALARTQITEPEEDESPRPRRPGSPARPAAPAKPARSTGGEKRRPRLTLVTALQADEVREHSKASFVRRTKRRMKDQSASEPKDKRSREVTIPEFITIQELANRMAEPARTVIAMLMRQGQMLKITDVIDADTAQLIAEELGHSVKRVAESDVEEGLFDTADDPATLMPRPPVVTIMGHVDHGKTSLLDAIRSTQVAAGEAGGITQHIGAYQVASPSHGKITFIDTPGHAAFTAMRARGAKVTDLVILVVAADDGVMPQTVEAIAHAKSAKVPMIVAINKIDKPDAKPERVRTELLQHEIQVETLGGEVLDVEVSATKKLNLERLLETIGLQAEILELKANPQRPAEGTVIEAKLDRGRGPVATVLVQRGTLKPGDIVVAGAEWGRVRALVSDTGIPVIAAGPSTPVEVLGFNGTPEAGDRLAVVDNEARAREVTDYRARQKREKSSARATGVRGSLEQMMAQAKTAGRKEFPLLNKAMCRARSRRSSDRSRSSARRKSGPGSLSRASAASPNPTCGSPRPRTPRSSASTCAPTRRRARAPSAPASRSATTTSSTIWWMT